ncbi:glycosyltransferase family 2 protein [Frigidibacter sp. MR17.24]|uniref:glycosyltransferase family 2 protein n=1 Tax=Frigidibacter sp. MR17.24 TaxID=3127345 RepID=UPI0030131DEA
MTAFQGRDAVVVIPHYNDSTRLGRCLSALAPQLAAAPQVAAIVVDNGSTGAEAEALAALRAAHPAVSFVTETKKGAAEARNRGVAETGGAEGPELICFLDCDCLPDPDWLARALAIGATRLAPGGDADLVGGTITLFDETPGPRSGAEAFEAVFAFDNRGYIEQKGFSVTANLLTRRAVFTATGPLIHGLSEDLEWCRRAVSKGFRLRHDDGLRVGHPSRSDWAALAKKWRRLTLESYGLTGGGAVARATWALRALAMPVSALAHGPRVLRHPALSGPEKRAGLCTLARLRLARMGWMLRQAVTGRA